MQEVEAQKLARNKAAIQERIDRLLAPKPANGRAVGGHVDAKEETAAAAEGPTLKTCLAVMFE